MRRELLLETRVIGFVTRAFAASFTAFWSFNDRTECDGKIGVTMSASLGEATLVVLKKPWSSSKLLPYILDLSVIFLVVIGFDFSVSRLIKSLNY